VNSETGSPKVVGKGGKLGQVEKILVSNLPFILYMRTEAKFLIYSRDLSSKTSIFLASSLSASSSSSYFISSELSLTVVVFDSLLSFSFLSLFLPLPVA
jgi:hypothetical protein